ncbi:lectin c-type domain-containing protein [Phthorimaea operculella]|nr:lectin c-type domain-containing protein [Phthorimaea operculella]
MSSIFEVLFLCALCFLSVASYHEQYRVPNSCSKNFESYFFKNREYIVSSLSVNWENAKILCRGHHNASLAILDTKEKAEFMAEALSESQFFIESLWVGARRQGADDPSGYRWSHGLELRRTALDIISDDEKEFDKHYPMWVNRTRVPVPEGGADCVAMDRVDHDKPVFLDLPCHLERGFACEREAQMVKKVSELKTVRCRTGLYRVYDGSLDWNQAAAYCVLHNMALANIGTVRCLKKLGMTMLKTRPSIENAWIGARGSLGKWWWVDTGADIFQAAPYNDAAPGAWPPLRDHSSIKSGGCLQLDRHAAHPPVFLEARCERKMQFICYQSAPQLLPATAQPSDDLYYYVLVRQPLDWQHAFDNCQKMNGILASIDTNEILIQLLLVMGENKDSPIGHIWLSGRLNTTRDGKSEDLTFFWTNPATYKRIPDHSFAEANIANVFIAPWLDEDFTMDSPCLNLDRQDHLKGLVYGLPCDVPQYSICMINKNIPTSSTVAVVENTTTGYEST